MTLHFDFYFSDLA